MSARRSPLTSPKEGSVVTKAVLRAAEMTGVSAKVLASVLGVSESEVSRMKQARKDLAPGAKSFDLGVMFLRLFRSLDAIVGGERAVAAAWLKNHNTVLDGRPIEKIQTIAGLTDVIAYLDARRAVI